MKSLLIVNIIAQKISLTIQILIAIPELPFFYPAYASSWRRSMRPLMVLRL